MVTTSVLGLGTFRALTAIYSVAADLLVGETNPEEIALLHARLALLRSATLTKWKARLALPVDPATRAILAEDLADWGKPDAGLIEEFERNSPNHQIRMAFTRIAGELGEGR